MPNSRLAATVICFICFSGWSPNSADDEKRVAGKNLEEWSAKLESENEFVRLLAVKSLGAFGESAVPALAKALGDVSDGVRYWSADHLGRLGIKSLNAEQRQSAMEQLKKMAGETTRGESLAASYALFQADGQVKHLNALVEAVEKGKREFACSAAEFLGKIGPKAKSLLPKLESQYQSHADYHVRGACLNAIRKIKEVSVK